MITISISAQTGMDSIMVNEINKVRGNPKSYIPVVERYIELQERYLNRIKSGKSKITSTSGTMTKSNGIKNTKSISGAAVVVRNIKAAKELIIELRNMKPLNELLFCQSIDSITNLHGKYLDSVNVSGHFGLNGQTLTDRFEGLKLKEVTENVCSVGSFIYTTKNVTPIILMLLVDGGIKDRAHRKNILNPKSKFIGIYMSKGTCVQNFTY